MEAINEKNEEKESEQKKEKKAHTENGERFLKS